jgi:dihydrodipicolinate synthase/N-acetylneuraminate lyase
MRTFGGAWVALVTPFTADNQVNVPVLQDLTEYLLGKGVEGLYLCGLTGQGMNMSVPERKLVVETVIGQVNKRVPAIVGRSTSGYRRLFRSVRWPYRMRWSWPDTPGRLGLMV